MSNASDAHLYAYAVMLTCPWPVDKVKTATEAILISWLIFVLSKLPRKLVRFLLPAPTVDELLAVDPVSQFNNEVTQRLFPNVTFLLVKFQPTEGWRERRSSRHYDLLGALPYVFPRVTTLELFDLLKIFDETVQFICPFPELETLALSFVEAHDLKAYVDYSPLPVGLKTVTLRRCQREAECAFRRVGFRNRAHTTAYQFYIRRIHSGTFQAVSEARKHSSGSKAYF